MLNACPQSIKKATARREVMRGKWASAFRKHESKAKALQRAYDHSTKLSISARVELGRKVDAVAVAMGEAEGRLKDATRRIFRDLQLVQPLKMKLLTEVTRAIHFQPPPSR